MRPMPSTLDLPAYKCETSPNRNYNTPNPITHAQTHSRSLTSLVLVTYRCHGCLDQKYRVHGDLQIIAQVNVYSPVYVVYVYVPRGTYTQRKCYEDQRLNEMFILIRCLSFQCKYVSQLPQTVYTWRKTLFNTIQMFIRYRKII